MYGLSFYKERIIPVAHALLWLSGIWFALWGTEFFDLKKSSVEARNTYALALVYIVFLIEVALSYLDIGYSNTDKSFNAKGYKSFGWLILNIVITIICSALYISMKIPFYLIVMAVMSSLLKYRSVFMARNAESYYADEYRKNVFTTNNVTE